MDGRITHKDVTATMDRRPATDSVIKTEDLTEDDSMTVEDFLVAAGVAFLDAPIVRMR